MTAATALSQAGAMTGGPAGPGPTRQPVKQDADVRGAVPHASLDDMLWRPA